VDHLRFLEQESSSSLAEAAVRFSFSDPTVSTVIPGVQHPHEVDANMHAWRLGPLPEQELQRIRELWQQEFRHFVRTSFYPVTQ
jgi:aryl-alcohol dehydrogenase-like predicted oxidoreductase